MGHSAANCSSRDAAERCHSRFSHRHSRESGNPGTGQLTNALDPRFRGDDEEGGYREAVPKPPPFENDPFPHCSAVAQTAGWNVSHRPRPGGCLPTAASPSLPCPRGGSAPMAGRPKRRRISFARSKPWVRWERPQRPSGWVARRPIASATARCDQLCPRMGSRDFDGAHASVQHRDGSHAQRRYDRSRSQGRSDRRQRRSRHGGYPCRLARRSKAALSCQGDKGDRMTAHVRLFVALRATKARRHWPSSSCGLRISLTSSLSILRPSMSTISKRHPLSVKCSPSSGRRLSTASAWPAAVA